MYIHMSALCTLLLWMDTHTNTLMRTNFLQQTVARSQLNMMKWIWLINRNRNSITLYIALFQSPSLFPFSLTWQPPTQPHLPWFHHHHPFSFLHSSSQLSAPTAVLFIFLILLPTTPCPLLLLSLLPSPLVSNLKHTQAHSGTERRPRSDLRSEL